jgi:predicted urease superfamily metal-dependent hydrolase
MYSPIHHPASTPMMNIQSTLQNALDLCKNVSVAVVIHTQSLQSHMGVNIHTPHSKDAGRTKEKNK